jgi:AcrR family transcriptional regulator
MRGEARYDRLVEAAITAVSRRGAADVRVRDVASAAGVSTGTVHYHLGDIEDLLTTVHERAIDRFVTGRRELLAAIPDAREKLRVMLDTGLPAGPDDDLVVALYDLSTLFRRGSAHRVLVKSLFDQQVGLYCQALEVGVAQGHFVLTGPMLQLATTAVALEDALGLHIVTGNSSLPPAAARHLLAEYLAGATGCTDLVTVESPGE